MSSDRFIGKFECSQDKSPTIAAQHDGHYSNILWLYLPFSCWYDLKLLGKIDMIVSKSLFVGQIPIYLVATTTNHVFGWIDYLLFSCLFRYHIILLFESSIMLYIVVDVFNVRCLNPQVWLSHPKFCFCLKSPDSWTPLVDV